MNALLSTLPVLLGAASKTPKASSSGSYTFLILIVVAGVGLYLYTRSQKKKMADARSKLSALTIGDRVMTIGGIMGTVVEFDDETFTIISERHSGQNAGAQRAELVFSRQALAKRLETQPTGPADAELHAPAEDETETGDEQ